MTSYSHGEVSFVITGFIYMSNEVKSFTWTCKNYPLTLKVLMYMTQAIV
jgi:hypothetical protein